jgi:hypothetical protein
MRGGRVNVNAESSAQSTAGTFGSHSVAAKMERTVVRVSGAIDALRTSRTTTSLLAANPKQGR